MASEDSHSFIQMETANMLHSSFHRIAKAEGDHIVELEFRIRQNNLESLEKLVLEISTPGSERYGKHLTKQQLDEYTANPTGQQVVMDYLHSINASVVNQSSNGMIIKVSAPVSTWDTALAADFSLFRNDKGEEVIRTTAYSLPSNVAKEVAAVFNTVQFPAQLFGGPKRIHAATA